MAFFSHPSLLRQIRSWRCLRIRRRSIRRQKHRGNDARFLSRRIGDHESFREQQGYQRESVRLLVVMEYVLHTALTPSVANPLQPSSASGIAAKLEGRCNRTMGTKSREVIWGGRVGAAKISAEHARKRAIEAAREADGADAFAWSLRMEGFGGPAQPSPTIAQCLNGGYGWLEIECKRCKTRASIPLDAVRRSRDTPIWKLESAFRCRSCGTKRYKPPVHMIKLTQEREITPYRWVHPDDER